MAIRDNMFSVVLYRAIWYSVMYGNIGPFQWERINKNFTNYSFVQYIATSGGMSYMGLAGLGGAI